MTFTDRDFDKLSADNARKFFIMDERAALIEYVHKTNLQNHNPADRDLLLVGSIEQALCNVAPRFRETPAYVLGLAEAVYDRLINEGRLIPRKATL